MTTYGVTPTGFVRPDLDTIVTEIEDGFRATFGAGINLTAPSAWSQVVGLVASREMALWDAAEAVYNSQYPNTAADQSLDNVSSITGTVRQQATKGTVTLKVNLNAGITLPAGQLVSAGAGTAQWTTTAPITNSGGAPADVTGPGECTVTGPIPASAGTLTTIVTPYTGWNSATNDADAVPGVNRDTDPQLRTRRTNELTAPGSSTVDALFAALSQLKSASGALLVTQATVFQNDTDATNGDGVPPHAVECVVLADPSHDQAIRECIWQNLAAGIRAYGSTTGTVTDSQGFVQEVDFSHPTPVPIYATIELTKNATTYGGDAAVKTAVAAYINALLTGVDVYDTQLYGPIFGVGGIIDVTKLWVSSTFPPAGPGDVAITSRQKATCVTTNVSVTAT